MKKLFKLALEIATMDEGGRSFSQIVKDERLNERDIKKLDIIVTEMLDNKNKNIEREEE